MNDKFFELKREKQDRIINGALQIFSKFSYKHASTDRIVEEASISKGLLFHYFGSKEGVYSFLYDYSIRFVDLELYSTISIKETDYFELLREMEEAHNKVREKHFYMLAFLKRAEAEEDKKIQKMIDKKSVKLKESYQKILDHADMRFLDKYSNKEQIQKIIHYCMNGFDKEYEQKNTMELSPWITEKEIYIDVLEKLIKN